MIPRLFGASLMSNTKWRKLFIALDEPGAPKRYCEIKFVRAPIPRHMLLPGAAHLHAPLAYVDSDVGPFPLRSIEWLEVICTPEERAKILAALSKVGHFATAATDRGLRIIGHAL